MKKFTKIYLTIFGIMIFSSVVFSQTRNVPSPSYPTIQSALNNAPQGVRIIASAGTPRTGTSLTIPSGVTLEISSANIIFDGELVVNGILIASNSTLNFADGLVVTYGQFMPNSSTLNFANKGLVVSNATIQCSNTTFTGYSQWDGIAVHNSFLYGQPFNNCTISNAHYGIACYNGQTRAIGCKFILCRVGYASLNNASISAYSNNVFQYNSEHDIFGDALSVLAAGSVPPIQGNNSFRSLSLQYHMYTTNTSSHFYALNNYWAGGPRVFGDIDASQVLPTDPNPSIRPGNGDKAEVESELFLRKIVVKSDEPIKEKVPGIEELDKAMKLLFTEKYEEALSEMYRLVNEYKDGFVGKRALVHIEEILAKTDRVNEILSMLEQYSNGKSKVAQFAEYRKAYQYLHLGEYNKAIEIINATEFSKEDADLKQAKLYDLGLIYRYYLGKKAESYDYFNELVNTYPDCPLSEMAKTFYKVTKYNYNYEKPTIKDETIINETKLFSNYPNPFNPTTIIKYQLSEASQVNLKIYDVMGKEITTLVNCFQNKGSYDITFNAQGLSSGIYFYKLNVNGKQQINKMLLMK